MRHPECTKRICKTEGCMFPQNCPEEKPSPPTAGSGKRHKAGEWMNCWRCGGKGTVTGHRYFATKMPPPEELTCGECDGRKRVFVIPDGALVIRESDANA